ncbi:MAG: hypothetical protein HYX51_01085 [Chloroflexi bacterium]|nr:hypothetical protein [Chloroflexota bacterium]
MPPLAKMRSTALADLAAQFRFLPAATARRQLTQAEGLLTLIQPEANYPEDWLVHHLTGYRPETDAPALIAGSALLADLAALVDRLSVSAAYRSGELPGWLSLADLCSRWRVSRKTVERYRRRGLLARRVHDEQSGKPAARFSPRTVEAFETKESGLLARAAKFSRLSNRERARALRDTATYTRRLGLSRTAAAQRLSKRLGRSPEALRQALVKAGARAGTARLTPRQAAEIERLYREALTPPRTLARRFNISPATVHRVVRTAHARRLRSLGLPRDAPTPSTLTALLARDANRLGLGLPAPPTLHAALADAQTREWPDAKVERSRTMALRGLLARAGAAIAAWPAAPGATAIDRVRTDLLWAARLKAELVRTQTRLLLGTIEGRTPDGLALADLPARQAAALWATGLAAASAAVDRFDPARGGRLAAPVGIALNRALAGWFGAHRSLARAAASADTPMPDWTRTVCPWQAWCEPPEGLRAAMGLAAPADRELLMPRLGWLVSEPTTIERLAQELGLSVAAAATAERRALRRVLSAAGP